MARKAKKIDIFEDKPLDIIDIRRATLEEMAEKKDTEKPFNISDTIKREVVGTLKDSLELATAILKDDVNMENSINDELSKNKAYKDAQSPKTPKSILKYQKTNNKKFQDEVNKEIKEHGVNLAKGQALFHGGLENKKVGDTIETTDTLSTTLNPHVAISNALHNGKAEKEGELNLNILTTKDEDVKAFIFNNRTKMSHEKEVLLERGLELKVNKRTKIKNMEVMGKDFKEKTISVYVSEVEVSKKK